MPSKDTFPADEAKLVSIFVQSILYGIFTVLFVGSVSVLWRTKGKRSTLHYVMLWTLITMWVVATTQLGVNFARIIEAFIVHRNGPGGPAGYFDLLSNFTNLFGSALYLFQTLLGDAFILYRCAIVWGYDWRVVAFPFLLLLGSTTTAIGVLYSFAKTADGVIFLQDLAQWILSFFSLTLATNLICTSLLAIKIWTVNSFTSHVMGNDLRPVLLVILETGAIYSATLITLLICYQEGSWAQYLLIDAVPPIVGIVFSMVILRLGLRLSAPDGTALEFRDSSTRSTLWNPPHLRNNQGIKLHVATDKVVRAKYQQSRSDMDTQDESVSPAWHPPPALSDSENV